MSFITASGVAALALLLSQAQADDPKQDTKSGAAALVGTYEIVSGEKGGHKIAADRLKDVTVRIAANAITTFDKDKKEVYVATYELDAREKSWRITMTATVTPAGGKGTKAEGLIAPDGDTVRLIYALPGGKAPTQFKAGENQQMFVLKRTGK